MAHRSPPGALGPSQKRLLIFPSVENDDDLSANIWLPRAPMTLHRSVRSRFSSTFAPLPHLRFRPVVQQHRHKVFSIFFWREGEGIMDTRLIVSLLFNWIRIGFEMHRNFVIFLLFKENLNLKVVRYFVKLIIIVYKYLYNSLIFFVLEFGLYNLLCKFFRQSLQFFIVS